VLLLPNWAYPGKIKVVNNSGQPVHRFDSRKSLREWVLVNVSAIRFKSTGCRNLDFGVRYIFRSTVAL
jgi:hypothetical protein